MAIQATYTPPRLVPTAYHRFIRRDTDAPTRVLQVWWTTIVQAERHIAPEQCGHGEWRDVPIVAPEDVKATP